MRSSESAPSAPPPAAEAVDVILRDGGTLRLRAPTAADAGELVEFFARLSERSFTCASTACGRSMRPWSSRTSIRTGRSAAPWWHVAASTTARSSRSRATAAPRPGPGRGRVRGRRQRAGPGNRHEDARAARRPARHRRHRQLRRRGDGGEPRRCSMSSTPPGSRRRERSSTARSSCRSRSRPTELFEKEVEARDHTAVVGVAPTVLRAGRRRRARRLAAARLDRRRAVPQHPRGVTSEARPTRSTARATPSPACTRYRVARRAPGSGRARRDLRARRRTCCGAAEAALAQGVRALCVISAGFAEVGTEGRERQDRAAGSSSAPTAPV